MAIIIQYASDLHLEFQANKQFLKQHPIQAIGDVLVLAGDVVPFALMNKHRDFFDYLSDHFATTYWLPGNHEYYQSDLFNRCGTIYEKIRSNVFLVNNTSVVHQHTHFIFSTLWSHISPGNEWHIERNLNDFYRIKYKGFRFNVEHYNQLHLDCLSFIESQIKTIGLNPCSVFTHHCPTLLNYPENFKGDILNEAFAVELYDVILNSSINLWCYGHHHTNTPTFNIGNTQLITNQLGYVELGENRFFRTNSVIEI
jgi:predicted phosphohydrolase